MNYREINSLQNDHIKKLIKLKDKKYRDQYNLALIEGWNLIKEAAAKNVLTEILITKEQENFITEIKEVDITFCSSSVLLKLIQSKNSQNIVGVIDLTKINKNKLDLTKNILLLDNIQDPGNLGTLMRTALGFNFENVILCNNSVDIFNDKVLRATQGALFKLTIAVLAITDIKKIQSDDNYLLVTTNLGEEAFFLENFRFDQKKKYIVALGNEGHGISSELQQLSDINIKIKMNIELESFNVAQAGTILMYEINKQMEE